MKAVGYRQSLPVEHAEALIDFEPPDPKPHGRDLLVAVKAVSSRVFFLFTACTTHHGASRMCVRSSITSLACV